MIFIQILALFHKIFFLVHDTIKKNIQFSKINEKIDNNLLKKSIAVSQLQKFIKKLGKVLIMMLVKEGYFCQADSFKE